MITLAIIFTAALGSLLFSISFKGQGKAKSDCPHRNWREDHCMDCGKGFDEVML